MKQAVPAWVGQTVFQGIDVRQFAPVGTEAITPDFETLTGFLQGFLKVATNAHGFTYGFHLQAQRTVGPWKLVEIPARHFHNHVVDGRLEKRRGGAGDRVH